MSETEKNTTSQSSLLGTSLAIVVWLLGIGVVWLGARRYLPPVASQHGVGIDTMLIYLLATTGTLIFAGHVALGYFILRFSRGAGAAAELPGKRAQRFWSIVPAVVIAFVAEGGVLLLGLPVFAEMYTDGPPENAVIVEVTGEQFTWNVRYPGPDGEFGSTDPTLYSLENPVGLSSDDPKGEDDIVDLALIYVPVNRPVRIRLRSKDVLHSFYLPNHRIKQDAVPGMTIELWFVPTVEGEFDIACAELCGFGHYQMRGFLHVVSESEFEQYLRERQSL